MAKGLIHLYWGDGKGKTTAAMGVAMRALAAGKKVVIVQFLKRTGERGNHPAFPAGRHRSTVGKPGTSLFSR